MDKKRSKMTRKQSIRSNLLMNFILVALLPTSMISIGSAIFGYFNAQQNSVRQLESIASLKEIEINNWIESAQNELMMTLNETYLLERIQVTLQYEIKDNYYDIYKDAARYRMNRYLGNAHQLKTISLFDLDGNIVLSTDPLQEDKKYQSELFFEKGLAGAITEIVNLPTNVPRFLVLVAYPVVNPDGQVIGELVGEIKPETLIALLGIDELSDNNLRIYLVDKNYNLFDASSNSLLSSQAPNEGFLNVHNNGIDEVIEKNNDDFLIYRNDLGQSVYGVHHWISTLETGLLVEQSLSTVLADIVTNQGINLLIILAGSCLAVFISISTASRIATPLTSLAKASVEIASGNFTGMVDLNQNDEIGVLAKTFNSMATQLRELVENLEIRVKDRTAELQMSNQQLLKKALQMETTSLVSREITSILDIDNLLNRVVNLIRESFSYYHVSIYLLDRTSNQLVWRASSGNLHSETQIVDLDLSCLISQSARENRAITADDFRYESSFLVTPSLPETLSELVIPLRMGGQVIGTMDIHHNLPDAFSTEDIKVLQGLGDQIAIAIHNAILYEKNQELAILEERNRMAREMHDSISQMLYCQVLYADAGSEYFHAGQYDKALEFVDQLKITAHQALKEMRLMIYELRPSILENEGLTGAIQHRLETVEQRSGVETYLDVDPSLRMSKLIEKELYMIMQEALNNVLKHSQAHKVVLTLSKYQEDILFAITDDGVGFDPETIKSGFGLSNIQQRTIRVGGVMTIESKPGHGTRLSICISGGDDVN